MMEMRGFFGIFGGAAARADEATDILNGGYGDARPSMSCPVFLLMEDACMSAWVHRPSILSSLGDYESRMLAREIGNWSTD